MITVAILGGGFMGGAHAANYKTPEISVYAIYPQTRHLSIKVRVFIDFLVERFGGRPYWDLVE